MPPPSCGNMHIPPNVMPNPMQLLIKKIKSYFKSDWKLEDYPVVYRLQKAEDLRNPGRFKKCQAEIINWYYLKGLGDTKSEAYIDLKNKFDNYKKDNILPRPGVKISIKIDPFENVSKYEEIAEEFFKNILDLNFREYLITDASCLGHFTLEKLEDFNKKINEYYELKIKNSDDLLLWELFELINEKKGKA
jgi:hypothetical protein